MNVRSILMKILPFLYSAAERFWEGLPEKSKEALINAGQFGQLLKLGYAQGYQAFVESVSKELSLSQEQIDTMLVALAAKLNIDIDAPNRLFDKIQAIIDKGMEDSAWDNFWTSVTGQLQIIFTGGRFNWAQLSMGIIQFVYERFVVKRI